jgi:LPXTG-site transpeptidase (sortase) family protein
MNQREGRVMNPKPRHVREWMGLSILGVLLIVWLVVSSFSASQAAAPNRGVFAFTPSTPVANLPIILKPYYTPTPTFTLTPTSTIPTPTRTPTGPTPTQTATGTITPLIVITTATATPNQVNINQSITFTFKFRNEGLAPATNVAFLFSVPSSLDISSVTVNPIKGTKITDLHSVSIAFGTFYPNDVTIITVVGKVNATALTQNVSSSALITYDVGRSKTALVSYKIVGTALPGTGEMPIEPEERAGPDLSLLFLSLTFGLAAMFAIWYGFWARANKLAGIKWYFGIGFVLIAAAFVAGLAGGGFLQAGKPRQPAPIANIDTPTSVEITTTEMLAGYEIAPAFEPATPGKLPVYRHITPEPLATLPSYPIPSPTMLATPAGVTETLDTSPVVRLVIPALQVDAVVKYVPWDTTLETWLISGLHQEIAWLGGSSWPGLGSNTVLAGHVTIRDYGNGPFRYLDKLAAGDEITVYTNAKIYTYRVRQSTVVEEGDMWVTEATQNPQLTLITCTDWNRDLQLYQRRLVIFADLVRSDPITASAGN